MIQVSRSKGRDLLSCALLHGLNHAYMVILPPLYLSMRDDLRLPNLSRIMLLGTIYLVVYSLMNLPFGFLGDRFSKKKILIFGAVVNSLAFLTVAGAWSYPVMVVAMVLAGIGGGAYHPVANALISTLFRDRMGRAFGFIGMGSCLGLFLGPLISGFIGQRFGWRTSCILFALSGLIIATVSVFTLSDEEKVLEKQEEAAVPWKSLAVVLLPVILTFGLRDFCLWGAIYLTPAMTQMRLGFSSQTAGALIALMSLTGLVSQPLSGAISDRIGYHRVIFILMVIGGLTVFLFPLVNEAVIFLVTALSGLMMMGTIPIIDAMAAKLIPPDCRGRVFGFMMTLGIMFGAVSPYVTGLIYDQTGNYQTVYFVLGAAALLGAGSVFFIRRRGTPEPAD